MKRLTAMLLLLVLVLTGCQTQQVEEAPRPTTAEETTQSTKTEPTETPNNTVQIHLQDSEITVDGQAVTNDTTQAVYVANDIVYYPAGRDFTFGEGTAADAHEAEEADAHTVVHITQPGTYSLSGSLSAGQIAIDLGEQAKTDPQAVVTLILDGVDITCTVAPAVIFYNVYECGNTDKATETVDTSAAGANVYLADGSENRVTGSYVAKIYKADTVELDEDGTEVENAKKLHKYDAAFYSKMSMNVDGNDGILQITAENEGLDSELHLTINGGDIRILSGNDGINTNEDGISVTTINGGSLNIQVTGETGEGDGIDSNGWLVINGGTVVSAACAFSDDAGLDSDMGIYLNGGTILATGRMLDRIAGGSQTYAVFTFSSMQSGGNAYTLHNSDGNEVLTFSPVNDFTCLIMAGDFLVPGDYTFYCGETQLAASAGQGAGSMGEMTITPNGEQPERAELPQGETPDGTEPPAAEMPGGKTPPEGNTPQEMTPPEDAAPAEDQAPQGTPGSDHGQLNVPHATSTTFTILQGGNYFSFVGPM